MRRSHTPRLEILTVICGTRLQAQYTSTNCPLADHIGRPDQFRSFYLVTLHFLTFPRLCHGLSPRP